MNALDLAFSKARPLLVTYLTAGDPSPEKSLPLFEALIAGGADILEIGVPFSDPGADGPTIQKASERALAAGGNLNSALALAAQLPSDHPKVLFGYLNPFLAYGYPALAQACKDAGIHGVLCVDCPPEEEPEFREALQALDIHPILLAAPTTPGSRIQILGQAGGGFLYYVSMTGVTGGAVAAHGDLSERLRLVKEHAGLPVAVGFGLRTGEDVRQLAPHVDAVVVGSALVRLVEAHAENAGPALEELCRELAEGLS
jgi:tryptophan synthase alpha chain